MSGYRLIFLVQCHSQGKQNLKNVLLGDEQRLLEFWALGSKVITKWL
jgi:hypothetical protein